MNKRNYFVYIISNKSNTIYVGVTSNLSRRLWQHQNKLISGFSAKYNLNKLVYYEEYGSPRQAIEREKQIKGWTRKKKVDLIKTKNPDFKEIEIWNKFRDPSTPLRSAQDDGEERLGSSRGGQALQRRTGEMTLALKMLEGLFLLAGEFFGEGDDKTNVKITMTTWS